MRTAISSLFTILFLAMGAVGYSGSANAGPHDPSLYGGAPCHTHWRIHTDSNGYEIGRERLAEHCAPVRRTIVRRPPVVLVPAPSPVIINHGPRNHFRLRTREFGVGVGWD